MARLSEVLRVATGCSGAWGSCLEERDVVGLPVRCRVRWHTGSHDSQGISCAQPQNVAFGPSACKFSLALEPTCPKPYPDCPAVAGSSAQLGKSPGKMLARVWEKGGGPRSHAAWWPAKMSPLIAVYPSFARGLGRRPLPDTKVSTARIVASSWEHSAGVRANVPWPRLRDVQGAVFVQADAGVALHAQGGPVLLPHIPKSKKTQYVKRGKEAGGSWGVLSPGLVCRGICQPQLAGVGRELCGGLCSLQPISLEERMHVQQR